MTRHSVTTIHAWVLLSPCSNSKYLISLIPPKLLQILDIYSCSCGTIEERINKDSSYIGKAFTKDASKLGRKKGGWK